jgi:4-carboxymuconolactone decarboxylase
MENKRYSIGLDMLSQVDGDAGHKVIDSLKDICPDLGDFVIKSFGDVYSRSELTLKEREIATVAALTVLGNCQPQLKVHISAALNVGCTEQQLKEIMIQMSLYAGFPAALNGMFALKDVLNSNHEK